MPTEPSVRFQIKNELSTDKPKAPPLANYEDFGEEFDYDDEDVDEVDGEFPLLDDSGKGTVVPRRRDPDRKVPAGFYPQWPTYYPEEEDNTVPSLNLYQQKKSMAQGMLDLALLSANANQLRYVLDSNIRNHYYYVSLSLISSSLVLQVLVAIALVFKSRYNMENDKEYATADRINNFILIGILLITITNVISSAFAPAPAS